MTTANKIRVNFVRRTIPRRGPFSTESYNASMEELAVDLADFGARWNTEVYPILNSLPRGSDETRWSGATNVPDPLTDGLDGDHMFVDNEAATSRDDGLFWDSTQLRPKTIREAVRDADDRITDIYSELSEDILDVSSGLSSDQWERLGQWVQDGTASLTTSVSYKARTGWDRLHTLMTDIFDSGVTDLGSLVATTYTIEQMLGALLDEHNCSWNSDPSTVNHSAISGILQTGVDASASYNQKTRGGASHLEDDMNHLRWEIARIKLGIATTTSSSEWSNDVTDPVGSGIACLKDHIEYVGNGTQDANNPHGIHRQDVDNLDTEFGYNNTFTGKSGLGSETPTYSSAVIVTQSASLETAIGELDAVFSALDTTVSAHIADTSNPHSVTALQAGAAVREVYTFTSHTDAGSPVVINHNKGTAGVPNAAFPLVQVINTDVGGDYGVLVDEVYVYEQEHGIVTTDDFLSIEYIDVNTFHVYTNVVNGVVVAVF